MTTLRFVEREGERVLQTLIMESYKIDYGEVYDQQYQWIDVPLVEEKEYDNQPDLSKYL